MNSVARVKELCRERGIPISKLERDLGFSNAYIGQLKKGTFPADRLAMIANYLNVSAGYLLTGMQEEPAEDTAGLDQELIRRLCSLTPEELSKVDAFIQGLLAAR